MQTQTDCLFFFSLLLLMGDFRADSDMVCSCFNGWFRHKVADDKLPDGTGFVVKPFFIGLALVGGGYGKQAAEASSSKWWQSKRRPSRPSISQFSLSGSPFFCFSQHRSLLLVFVFVCDNIPHQWRREVLGLFQPLSFCLTSFLWTFHISMCVCDY